MWMEIIRFQNSSWYVFFLQLFVCYMDVCHSAGKEFKLCFFL